MEFFNKDSIKEYLLQNKIINTLTLKEKNGVIDLEFRPKIQDSIKKYSNISSRAKLEKVLEKCSVECLKEEDFYMAFYDCKNEEVNKKLLGYIEKQEWFQFFLEALSDFNELKESDDNNNNIESKYSIQYSICFLILYAKKKLEFYLSSLKNISINYNVLNKMINQIVNNTMQIYSKTVIYEYHLNKHNYEDKKNNNRLNQYIKNNFFYTENILKFYLKYPVLIRRLSVKIINMIKYYEEFLDNLDKSYNDMIKSNMINSNTITDIYCDMGDTHEKGKFVIKVKFSDINIVYKPRNLYITQKYYEFINWINLRFDLYKLPIIKTIWNKDYTIESCVSYQSCSTIREIERFYTRMGYYIGILYLFNGNDIHYENIIACNEYPYIIDLETLFAHNYEQLVNKNMAIEKIVKLINQSVKGSCLLPSYMFRDNKDKGVDVSGLGGKKAEIPGKRLVLSNLNSNDIRFEMKKTYIENNSNIPMLNDSKVDYKKYTNFLISGFIEFMNIIIINKEEFKDKINKFNNVRTRQVLRATNNYGYMLQFASHPTYTQNMIYLERMLDCVWNHPYKNKKIASCEFSELIEDDIPVFYCLPSDTSVISGKGEIIENLYEESGINIVKSRIDSLTNKEINLQKTFIEETLGVIEIQITEERAKMFDKIRFSVNNKKLTKETRENVLKNIYRILEDNIVYGENDGSWIALSNDNFSSKTISYLSSNLYDGLSGIVLYLYYRSTIYNDNKCREMLKKIVVSLNNIQGIESKESKVDGMSGICSIIYPIFLYLQDTLDNKIIAMYDSVLSWCASEIEKLDNINIDILGISSIIILFFNLYDKTGDYKYYKIGKNAINKISDFGVYFILERSKDFEIDQLCYALQLAFKYLEDEKINKFEKLLLSKYRKKIYGIDYCNGKISNKSVFENIKFNSLSYIYKLKLYKLSKDDILFNEIVAYLNYIKTTREIDVENKLFRIDFLQELSNELSDDYSIKELCEKEFIEIINMYNLENENEHKKYNYIIHGLGLNSPICGLGYRLIKYNNSKVNNIFEF